MRLQPLLVSALLSVSALVAGCTSSTPAKEPADDLGLEVTEDTGIIRGVVVDPSVRPIPDAIVRIASLDRTAQTNAEGVFGFDLLDPGTYFLEASATGHVTVQRSVDVVAGVARPDAVRFVLQQDPSNQPLFRDFVWDGYMKCGLSVFALCGAAGSTTGDDFLNIIEVERPGVTYVQTEMQWRTSQAVSPNMWIFQEAVRSDDERECIFDNPQGPSPLIVNTTYGDYNKYGSKECFETLGDTTSLRHRVFTGSIDGTRPPTSDGCYPNIPDVGQLCSGVGATVEQEFQVFTHIFWGFKPPEGWTFGTHGEPAGQ